MFRRLVILALIVGAGFVIYLNRDQIAALAGLESNRIRIQGDWYEVQSGFKEDTRHTFVEELVLRDGEQVGHYQFTSHNDIEVTIDGTAIPYQVAFPEEDTMDWLRTIKGKQRLSRRWRR